MNAGGNSRTLDLELGTLQAIDSLAKKWGVSREAALKRALAQAAPELERPGAAEKIQAFKKLQGNLRLTPEKVAAWEASVREARR